MKIKSETRQRCNIYSLDTKNRRLFANVSLELYSYLYEIRKIEFSLFCRVGDQMIEYIKPEEFCRDLLEHIWSATQQTDADVSVCVLKKDLGKFYNLLDAVRQKKIAVIKEQNPNLDPRALDVFADLSGASQMIVKGGIDKKVASRAQAAASYMMNNMMQSQAAVGTLSRMIQIDPTLYDHSAAVAMFAGLMAFRFSPNINEKKAALVAQCGLYHDTGKSCIPAHILNKPGPFEPEEYEIMKEHTHHGCTELKKAIKKGAPIEDIVCRVALEHHERYAGHGYPYGKKGREEDNPDNGIHLYTRFVSIADAYSALLMERVYKPALSPEEAISLMSRNAEKNFDIEIYHSFIGDVEKSLRNVDQDPDAVLYELREKAGLGRQSTPDPVPQHAEKTLTYQKRGKRIMTS